MENEEAIQKYTEEIIKQFKLPSNEARILAEKLIKQIIAHGGGFGSVEAMEKTVSVVIKSWLEK